MLLEQKPGEYLLHPELVSSCLSSSQTLVFTGDQPSSLPMSVSSNLLRLFSPSLLSSVLDLPPCISTSLIIPDTNMITMAALLDLIRTGQTQQTSASAPLIIDLANSLGISLDNISSASGTVTTGQQQTSAGPRTVRVSSASGARSVLASLAAKKKPGMKKTVPAPASSSGPANIVRNIKEEARDVGEASVKYDCEICKKHFNGHAPLAFHYCKHFYKELQSLQFPDYIAETRCNKCEKTFPDKKAMLCHIGVKHKFINQVLAQHGLGKVPLGAGETAATNIQIKTEKQSFQQKSKTKARHQEKAETPRSQGRGRNKQDIKEVRFCEICEREMENVSQLANHMISAHFLRDIKEMCKNMYSGNQCTECNKVFKGNSVWIHLGAVHNKLDDVLIMKGFRPLKTIVTPKMRQVVVKRERPEEDNSANETPDFGLPNLFESVLATPEGDEDSNDFSDQLMVSDPLTT